eukprot:m.285926 g.285926  ORF g.285926 m.285926 type:complete len:236 (+) comp19918_c0_seq3:268-975(+)
MGNFFFKEKKTENSRVTEHDNTVLKVKTQRDKLKIYQKKIYAVIEKEKQCARELIKKKQLEKAKALLKKKKYQESLIDKTDAQITNLEELVANLITAKMNKEVLEGLEAGNVALKLIQEEMDIGRVEAVMDDLQDGIEFSNAVSALVSGKLTAEDESQLEAEFAEFMGIAPEEKDPAAAEIDPAATEIDPVADLPSPPTTEPVTETSVADDLPTPPTHAAVAPAAAEPKVAVAAT